QPVDRVATGVACEQGQVTEHAVRQPLHEAERVAGDQRLVLPRGVRHPGGRGSGLALHSHATVVPGPGRYGGTLPRGAAVGGGAAGRRGRGGGGGGRRPPPAARGAGRRDPPLWERVAARSTTPAAPADLQRYRAAGVHELVVVASPPADESRVAAWIEDLARE